METTTRLSIIALDNISSVIAADAKYVNNVSATGKISVSENQTVDNLTVFSLDNDTMGVMVVVVDNNSSENGTRGQMLVSLRSQPYDNVTLSFTIDNGTSATGIATGYCFPWIIRHQVTIRPHSPSYFHPRKRKLEYRQNRLGRFDR